MKPESYDHIFRSKLLQAEGDVPDHLWQHIDASLESSRKSNRWLIFLMLFPLAIAGYLIEKKITEKPELIEITSSTASLPQKPDKQVAAAVTESYEDNKEIKKDGLKTSGTITENTVGNVMDQMGVRSGVKSENPISLQAENQKKSLATNNVSQEKMTLFRDGSGLARTRHHTLAVETREAGFLKSASPKIDICPSFTIDQRGFRPFLEFSIAAGLPIRELKSSDSEWDSYRDLRKSTEKERLSIDLQALAGMDIGRHFEVKTGVGLNQIRESFQHVDESASRTITSIITDTIVSGGVVIVTRDTSVVTEYGQRIKRTNNALTRLDIPILAGYHFNLQNHRFTIGGGVAINLFFWQKGSILDPDGEIISINSNSSDSESIFVSRTGLDILTNIGYEIDLSASNSLRLTAAYRWSLKSITSADYPLNQRYSQVNLGLSLKHKL